MMASQGVVRETSPLSKLEYAIGALVGLVLIGIGHLLRVATDIARNTAR